MAMNGGVRVMPKKTHETPLGKLTAIILPLTRFTFPRFLWLSRPAMFSCFSSYVLKSSIICYNFFFSSRRRHTRSKRDWSSDVCSSNLAKHIEFSLLGERRDFGP